VIDRVQARVLVARRPELSLFRHAEAVVPRLPAARNRCLGPDQELVAEQ